MVHTIRVVIVAAVVTLLARQGYTQPPVQAPAPEGPSGADCGPVGPGPAPPWPAPVRQPAPYQDRNGPLLQGDPRLDGPPGWYAAVELDPVWAHVKNHLAEPVTVGDVTDPVHLPTGSLGVTVAPRLEFGYRFGEGAGEVLASYRFVETTGSEMINGLGPDAVTGTVHSRFDLNVLDLDYGSREFSLGPRWDMKWLAGVRLASLYFDSQAAGAGVTQRVTNHFGGAGPHTGLELWHGLDESGLALFARLDAELLAGQVRQSFTETLGEASGETDQSQVQAAPVLSAQAGLGWTPPGSSHLRVVAGYTFERWWDVGFVAESRAEVMVQGLFLRGEWRY